MLFVAVHEFAFGTKRTCHFAPHMSASDPNRTSRQHQQRLIEPPSDNQLVLTSSKPAAFQKSFLFRADKNLTKATAASGLSL